MGAVFEELTPKALHPHVHYLVERLDPAARAVILLGNRSTELPIVTRTYRRKPNEIGILIRTSSVGRVALESIAARLVQTRYRVLLRRSVKQKILNQCVVWFAARDTNVPLYFTEVLEIIARELNETWPPKLVLCYPFHDVSEALPGKLRLDPAWRAGRALGRFVGRVVKGARDAF